MSSGGKGIKVCISIPNRKLGNVTAINYCVTGARTTGSYFTQHT